MRRSTEGRSGIGSFCWNKRPSKSGGILLHDHDEPVLEEEEPDGIDAELEVVARDVVLRGCER
jgi:hypothetical protein